MPLPLSRSIDNAWMSIVPPSWKSLFGEVVVLDLSSTFVCVGTLMEEQNDYLLLSEVDVHDLRDAPTTREQYVLQCRRDGMVTNRRWAWIRCGEVVGLSRLDDVIID
jgi:hypothetical protein